MTAPVANPSRKLKIERVRRKIKALNAQMIEPGAYVAVLQAGIAAHEGELAKLRGEAIRETLGSEQADSYMRLWARNVRMPERA
jgi:hypothetical protein